MKNWTEDQHYKAWRNVPGNRHGKLFIDKPCKKRADDQLKLGRHQLRMIVAILTGHAPVRKHLHFIGLFDGDPTCRFCGMEIETAQHIICRCEALARQRYNTFGGLTVAPKDVSKASVRDLCLFIRGTGLLNLCWKQCLGLHNKPKGCGASEASADGPHSNQSIICLMHKCVLVWWWPVKVKTLCSINTKYILSCVDCYLCIYCW